MESVSALVSATRCTAGGALEAGVAPEGRHEGRFATLLVGALPRSMLLPRACVCRITVGVCAREKAACLAN